MYPQTFGFMWQRPAAASTLKEWHVLVKIHLSLRSQMHAHYVTSIRLHVAQDSGYTVYHAIQLLGQVLIMLVGPCQTVRPFVIMYKYISSCIYEYTQVYIHAYIDAYTHAYMSILMCLMISADQLASWISFQHIKLSCCLSLIACAPHQVFSRARCERLLNVLSRLTKLRAFSLCDEIFIYL